MINKVILLGHVGKDPEIRHLDNDRSVAKFTLATSDSYKNKSGEKVVNTEWHTIVAWRGLAEIASKYIKKGSLIYVEGKIRSRSWDDKDGNKRYTTEIDAENIQMVGKRPDDSGQHVSDANPISTQNDHTSNTDAPAGFDYTQGSASTDDLPF